MIIEFTAGSGLVLEFPGRYDRFIVNEGNPDFSLIAHYAYPPGLEPGKGSHNAATNLAFRSDGNKYIIISNQPESGVFRTIIIDADFGRGDLYITPIPGFGGPGSPDVCIYPKDVLDKIIFNVLLSRRRGVIIHGCGVVTDGHGLLFSGTAGSGKSTLANLWKQRKDVTVIGDERIVARQVDGRFWIYGTPWYSSAMTFSPLGAPLEKVFFISHGLENRAAPLTAGEAATSLLAQSFADFSEPGDVISVLGIIGALAEQVPCYNLGFVPDESVLEYIGKMY